MAWNEERDDGGEIVAATAVEELPVEVERAGPEARVRLALAS